MNHDLTLQLNRILSGMQPGATKVIFRLDVGSYKKEIKVVRYGPDEYTVELYITPKNDGEFANATVEPVFERLYFKFFGNCVPIITEFLGSFRLDSPEVEIQFDGELDLIGTIN